MNTIKSAASALRAHWSMKSQNRGRCIEIATAGLTGNPSWNHTTPDERESESLGRITSFTNAMTRESDIYWRLVELSIFKTHIECAEHAHSLLAIMIPDITEQLEKLRLASDIAPIGIPGKSGKMEEATFFHDISLTHQHYYAESWFAEYCPKLDGRREYYWDRTHDAALQMGFTAVDAELIRATQRECYQHAWEPTAFIYLGLYDGSPDRLLQHLKNVWDDGWRNEFEHLLAADGDLDNVEADLD